MMTLTKKEAYLRLQPALQEVLDLEAENVVKLHSVVAEDASPVKSPLYICLTMYTSKTHLTSLLRSALPSKSLRGFFSSKVSSSRAADLIRARLYFTRHTWKGRKMKSTRCQFTSTSQ